MVVIVLIAQFYIAVWPLGGGVSNAEGFFKQYLALPVVIVFFIVGYWWKREGFLTVDQIDVDTGRRCWDTAEDVEKRKQELAMRPLYVKIFDLIC